MNWQYIISLFFIAFVLFDFIESQHAPPVRSKIIRIPVRKSNKNVTTNLGIVGGYTAAEGAYPYMVSLRVENYHLCGASILARYWVLTAAQCVFGQDPLGIKLFVGTNHLKAGGIWYDVTEIIYKGFNPKSMENDIALLKLSDPLNYNPQIQPIELSSAEPPVGTLSTFTGWGSPSPGSLPTEALQYIKLKIFDRSICRSVWYIYSMNVSSEQICTLNGYGQGTCQGDAGGPLVVGGKQVGIASYAQPCAVGIPDVYTSISAYYDWIKNVTSVK